MDEFLSQKIAELKQKKLYRQPKGEWADGWLNFSTNDYLGMAEDERVIAAGVAAAELYGAGGQASRLAGGEHPLYSELETNIAQIKAYEAACVFGSGYLANVGTITALMGEGDLIIADKLAHNCLIEGSLSSGAKLIRFKHNCMEHSRAILQKERENYRNCLIVTEEIFSMDGDFGKVEGLQKLRDEFDCWLMVDGAHSLYNKKCQADIYTGTLSKAVGCYGGYVCGSQTLIDYIKTSAKTFIYSTALPPFVIGAAIKSLELIKAEKPYEKMPSFGSDSHIVPVIIGGEEETLQKAEELKDKKILVGAIRPPTVPKGTSRLRISLSAKHSASDIEKLKEAI